MTDGVRKLEHDGVILVAMAAQMADYLKSDVLFWRMGESGLPMLTLGGYLMRQYRLLRLLDLLPVAEQREVETAVSQFNTALTEKVVRLETKANHELEARLRQFEAFLEDLQKVKAPNMNYETAVEPRAMIAALIEKLNETPYQLNPHIPGQVETLDRRLRQLWLPGNFIWPTAWQPAYPPDPFWWLYGQPVHRPALDG